MLERWSKSGTRRIGECFFLERKMLMNFIEYGDLLYSVSCMEHEYLAVLKAEHTSDVVISEGDIVSGAYLVQGRLKA